MVNRTNADLPETQVTEENGLKVITEYRINDNGQKVKCIRKVKLVPHKERKSHAIAHRSKLKKFGAASKSSSFDDGTTVITDEIYLTLLTLKDINEGVTQAKAAAEPAKKPTSVNVTCRICKGEHWTTKCPYKETLGSLEELLDSAKATPSGSAESLSTGAANAATGTAPTTSQPPPADDGRPAKYVPPSLRGKTSAPSGSTSFESYMDRKEEENMTLRVSNLSEDTTDEDLHRLFSPFGSLFRCFLAKDRDTGRCKGFAFVGYRSKSDAERAMKVMNGKGFDSLILKVEWSAPRK